MKRISGEISRNANGATPEDVFVFVASTAARGDDNGLRRVAEDDGPEDDVR